MAESKDDLPKLVAVEINKPVSLQSHVRSNRDYLCNFHGVPTCLWLRPHTSSVNYFEDLELPFPTGS